MNKCLFRGHKFKKKVWNGYQCINCYDVSKYNHNTYYILALISTILIGFGLVLIFFIPFYASGYELRGVSCCNSMYPFMSNGEEFNITGIPCFTLVETITDKNIDNLTTGDIVAYKYRNTKTESFLHRINDTCVIPSKYIVDSDGEVVILTYENGFILKGDNNPEADNNNNCIPSWAINYKLKYKLCLTDFLK